MFNPPHPGKILRDALAHIAVTTAAKKLHVSRTSLSRILNGGRYVSPPLCCPGNAPEPLVRIAVELRHVAGIEEQTAQDRAIRRRRLTLKPLPREGSSAPAFPHKHRRQKMETGRVSITNRPLPFSRMGFESI